MVALRATGSNAELEAKAEKRQANSLANTLPMCPLGMEKQLATPPMYYIFVCRIQQRRKGRCIQFAPYKLAVGPEDECGKSVAPGLARGIPSGRGMRVDWRTAMSSHARDTRLDDNAEGLTEVEQNGMYRFTSFLGKRCRRATQTERTVFRTIFRCVPYI